MRADWPVFVQLSASIRRLKAAKNAYLSTESAFLGSKRDIYASSITGRQRAHNLRSNQERDRATHPREALAGALSGSQARSVLGGGLVEASLRAPCRCSERLCFNFWDAFSRLAQ